MTAVGWLSFSVSVSMLLSLRLQHPLPNTFQSAASTASLHAEQGRADWEGRGGAWWTDGGGTLDLTGEENSPLLRRNVDFCISKLYRERQVPAYVSVTHISKTTACPYFTLSPASQCAEWSHWEGKDLKMIYGICRSCWTLNSSHH